MTSNYLALQMARVFDFNMFNVAKCVNVSPVLSLEIESHGQSDGAHQWPTHVTSKCNLSEIL